MVDSKENYKFELGVKELIVILFLTIRIVITVINYGVKRAVMVG